MSTDAPYTDAIENAGLGSDADFKKLAAVCAAHGGATKAQVLVKWATQSGFVALPR